MFNHDNIDPTKIPSLKCDIIENVTVLPMVGDITGLEGYYALGAFANKKPLPQVQRMCNNDIQYYQLPYIKPWHYSEQEVIYGGIFFMHWGHFLLEDLQRLWYAKENNLPIVWSGTNGFSFTPVQFKSWQDEIFKALGIKNQHIFLTEPTQFAKVHFPESGSGINTHIHPQHAKFLEYYEGSPVEDNYVYLSRSKVRSCANEDEIETMLKKRGWRIVYPENLSVSAQLKTISTAKVCFMIGGSAQHTMLLAKNLQTRFIIIPREHKDTFNIIANLKSDDYYLLNLPKKSLYTDGIDEANAIFTLDVQLIENIVDKTNNFTENLNLFHEIFSKPEKLVTKQITIPQRYYEKPKPINKARKLFFLANFCYLKRQYSKAYKIFKHLHDKNLLEDFMFIDYFKVTQQYHLQNNLAMTMPFEKHKYLIRKLQYENENKPKNLRVYKALTDLFLVAGDFSSALKVQEQLMNKNEKWSKPLAQIAFIYSVQRNFKTAIEYAKKAVEIEPNNLKRKAELAGYLIKNKEVTESIKLLTQALRIHPNWAEGYIQLAAAHHTQGKLEKAIACMEKAVAIDPNNVLAHEQLSEYMCQNNDQVAAVELWVKALQKNPRHAERISQQAKIYAVKGQFTQAIEYAQKAVELEPRNFACKSFLATYLRQNKDYDAAQEVMRKAMHLNPFWSEPHAQLAAIYDAKGELDKAIDCARKAVAVEPYCTQRKLELENYRIKKIRLNVEKQERLLTVQKQYMPTCERIQSYIDTFYASTYLEIGISKGDTFLYIDVPYKVGVDPVFLFDYTQHSTEDVALYQETSDEFFEKFPVRKQSLTSKYHNGEFKFDVIFIDGLHTYEQTLRDFENSLAYSHEKTIWIIDDTVPSHCFSALSSLDKSGAWKAFAGMTKDGAWHGDVYKAIFAIHDLYPQFSYCTQIDNGNPQTILWTTKKPTKRKKIFDNIHDIDKMRYEDFIEHAFIMHPVKDSEVVNKFFTNIDPIDYKTSEEYKLVIKKIMSDNEVELKRKNSELIKQITKLTKNQDKATLEILDLQKEILSVTKENFELKTENIALKKVLQNKYV